MGKKMAGDHKQQQQHIQLQIAELRGRKQENDQREKHRVQDHKAAVAQVKHEKEDLQDQIQQLQQQISPKKSEAGKEPTNETGTDETACASAQAKEQDAHTPHFADQLKVLGHMGFHQSTHGDLVALLEEEGGDVQRALEKLL